MRVTCIDDGFADRRYGKMVKAEIAATLYEISRLLELKGENPFRCRAYQTAAQALELTELSLDILVNEKRLAAIPGIGSSMQEKISILYQTGELPELNQLRSDVPPGLLLMMKIPGLGPKKIKQIYETLGISELSVLKEACLKNQIAVLKGFGEKTQQKILQGIGFIDQIGQRVRIDQAYPLGLALLEQLRQLPGVIRSELCGSLRRRRETTKDIDILISSDNPKPIMDAFVQLPEVHQVTNHGETKSSIVALLRSGESSIFLNADLRVVSEEAFPFALHHFTGSKEHNIRMRSRAIEMGLSLSEYSLAGKSKSIQCKTETDIFAALGLDYIPPELREDTGELEAAENHRLPRLIEADQLCGVFHNHTTYSDGTHSLEEMAEAAKELGWEYFGVADHSQSLKVARGLSPAAVKKQHQEIDLLNKKLKGVQIIKGIECDILEDGSLDYDDDLLRTFDYVVASVHTHFQQSATDMTKRICTALRHPAVTMLGHATGRLLLQRPGYAVDLDAILLAAKEHHKMIEINAQPLRLDLDWRYCKKAKMMGIPLVINPDAHQKSELALVHFGIDVARRAWLEKADVFNTSSYEQVMKVLKMRKSLWKS